MPANRSRQNQTVLDGDGDGADARRVLLSAGVIDTFASGGLIGRATTVIIFGSAS